MSAIDSGATPSGHTAQGGVLLGSDDARRIVIVFEDPQGPYCRQFEEINGAFVTAPVYRGVPSNIACAVSSAKSLSGQIMLSSSQQKSGNSTSCEGRSSWRSYLGELEDLRPRAWLALGHK
jgi:hypothetical protein